MKPMQISFTSACQFVLAGWQEICRIADSAELEVYRRKMATGAWWQQVPGTCRPFD